MATTEKAKLDKLKKKVYEDFKKTNNKTKTASKFGISARTAGRYIDELSGATAVTKAVAAPAPAPKKATAVAPAPAVQPADEIKESSDYKYFVIYDGTLINVTRVCVTGGEAPLTEICYNTSPRFEKALALYNEGKYEEVYAEISAKQRIENLSMGKVTCYPAQNRLVYEDGPNKFEFTASLANRVIDCINNDKPVDGLMQFANRLSENPSRRAVTELFDFLQAMDIEITPEGMVRCFKKVRQNYTDVHTGKFDNSVGTTVSMPRHMVNDDSEVTCSHGLHVCSKAYLRHFGGEKIIMVDVDPADFVSIPKDYYSIDENNVVKAKARVCRYVVVSDVTGGV